MVHRYRHPKVDHERQELTRFVSLLLRIVFLFAAISAGADNGPIAALIAELTPRITEPGFTSLAISKARGLNNINDSVTLISTLLSSSTRAADARDLYVELATIQELLGRYEDAADSWESAIAAKPGQGETAWLLSAAACKLAIGDAETAAALAKAALLTTATPRLVALAILIEARAMMLSGDLTGALARSLEVLAVGASGLEAAALVLARDVSSGAEREGYAERVQDEYPGRAEIHNPLISIFSLIHSDLAQYPGSGKPYSDTVTVSEATSSAAQKVDGTGEAVSSPLYYQLGAFRDEANAALLSTKLARAGFRPETVRRESRTGVLSIVYLEAGPDPARLMVALKDAGFESWPLFTKP